MAYTFLEEGEGEASRVTYADLDFWARAVGAELQQAGVAGQRALLLFQPGLEFIAAFLGCLYSGVVAVPAYPPRKKRGLARLSAIAADAQPAIVLTTPALVPLIQPWASQMSSGREVRILPVERGLNLAADSWRDPGAGQDTLAFLQYTSGSTATPKGVMVTHGNLLANEEMIRNAFDQSSSSVIVSWLPLYHDMGLIGGVLQPLYVGASCVLMSPVAFLQKPLRWLEAITRYKATTSGGPNFAYDLCVQKIPPAEREHLDLSSWTVAFNGAEPIRAETLERFAQAFAGCGFRRGAFYPCYGLAEATLFVTGGQVGAGPRVVRASSAELEQNRLVEATSYEEGRALVGCGWAATGHSVAVVDAETRKPCSEGHVGEVWVAGASVAAGYWNRPDETERDFRARLHSEETDSEGTTYLRTGDLGFLHDGDLFVTGRLKDLIIVRGRNLYPQDIESTAERSHQALRPGCGAAFPVNVEGEERVVLVQEIDRHCAEPVSETVVEAIRAAVAREHEVLLHDVALIKTGTIPKTSSGKIQRRACREDYLRGALAAVARVAQEGVQAASEGVQAASEEAQVTQADARVAQEAAPAAPAAASASDEGGGDMARGALAVLDADERRRALEDFLLEQAARILRVSRDRLDARRPLVSLGFDSLAAVELKHAVETRLGVSVSVSNILDEASLAEVADEVMSGLEKDPSPQGARSKTLTTQTGEQAGQQAGQPAEFPLSYGQRGLWFLQRLAPEAGAYNIAAVLQVEGELDAAALGRAFRAVVERHPSLRATFHQTPNGEPVQRVHDGLEADFACHSAADWDQETLGRRLCHEAWRPFDLERGPLVRAALFERSRREHVLALTAHHLVADFHSLAVMFDELTRLYGEEAAGFPAGLRPLPAGYSDYVARESESLAGPEGERLWDHWREVLSLPLPTVNLPTDRPRPAIQTYRGASRALTIDPALAGELHALARNSGASLFALLLAAFKVLLHRHTGQTDLLVGCPAAGRGAPEFDGLVGYFVNPLPLRSNVSDDPPFGELLRRVRRATLEALERQEYPFALLAERLNLARDPSRPALFQVMFALQKARGAAGEALSSFALGEAGGEVRLGGLTFRSVALAERQVPFDLTLMVAERDDDLVASLQYNRDLFDDETAGRMLERYRVLLAAVVSDPQRPVSAVELLTTDERERLLVGWNSTRAEFAHDALVHELFEAQVDRTPGAVAVESEGATLSYAELEARANRVANRLRREGAGPGTVVGVYVERSLNLAVALLGILKAGAAYLPLDPAHPAERLRLILDDARVPLVLTGERLAPQLADYGARLLLLDADWPDISRESGDRPAVLAAAGHVAYVLYTSGSTGKPKGVEVSHRAVVNFLHSMRRRPGLADTDVFVSVTTPSFDIFGLELYLPLMVGARLVLPSHETTADGARLLATMRACGATAMQATPATWRLLLAAGWRGEPRIKLLCGGEALPWDLARELCPHASSVWNLYGPTETTIWSAVQEVSAEEEQPGWVAIGRPIDNTTLYVLDSKLRPAPVGVPGELFIGGDGLAQGYRGLAALTAEKFVPDHLGGEAGARLYRTGDLARRRADGVLEFFGRLDNQVKVRGFRVEVGEVEAALAECPGVGQSVVRAWEDESGGHRLVGYVVPAEGTNREAVEAGRLRSFLLERLPDPFIPSLFVTLDALPLTPNGKVDRKALPRPEAGGAGAEYVAPRSSIEQAVAEIWRETLGVERVGANSNFFDLGGHSLLLAQVQSRLAAAGHEVSMLDLFRHSTVGALAEHLARQGGGSDAVRQGSLRGTARRSTPERARAGIAIVGMAGRFPRAASVEEFWKRLCDGDECITFFSDEELAEAGVGPEELNDASYVKAGGVLEGAELFDATFFGYHPREAELMDPQHRVFLECAWHALEDAGYDSARYGGRVGVFAGAGLNTYLHRAAPTLSNSSALRYQAFIGNDKDFVTTRASYKLNLKGPSINVQTACSTSLVAVHLACQSILAGECDMALAGGVAVRASQREGYFYEEGGILSPDAHCRAFDREAQGTVFGNGVGVVVLKPLEAALRDGDHVYAVVRGSAVNNDGALKIGYTAPSVDGQAEVISEALAVAGVEPESVGYVEAHGTGTPLGDPIEVAALGEAFRAQTGRKQFCALGSVKTNIGHLDTAAGVAGLIKTACALRHGLLPPTLNFAEPNPKIDFENSAFYVNAALSEWKGDGAPRRAGVSSFGIGGTNAHVVLEEAPAREPSGPSRPWQLLTLSAKTSTALEAAAQNLGARLKADPSLVLADAAYTTQVGRQPFAHRRVVLCRSTEDAVAALESSDPERVSNGFREEGRPSVVFLFPGQGTQHVGMARGVYETEPDFARELDACAELFRQHLGLDLREVMFAPEASAEEAAARLEQTRLAQPALFAIEYALARLWESWGVRPTAMLGHSVGEYVAACVAGVMTLEEAAGLVAARGRLMQRLPGGAMLGVQLPEDRLRPLLVEGLSLAAVNAPSASVVSGPAEAVARMEALLAEQGIAHTRLRTSHAFHSAMMEPALEEFAAEVARCRLKAPRVPYVSNLTGTWITAEQATDPGYWARHLRETVRFSDGVQTLLAEPDRVLLEVGPGRTLTTLVRQHGRQANAIPSLPHPRDERPDAAALMQALGRAWAAGVEINWQGFYARERRHRVSLPPYPFEGQRFWIKAEAKSARSEGPRPGEWFYAPTWRRSVLAAPGEGTQAAQPWLVLDGGGRFAERLVEHLRGRGHEVVTARAGAGFERLDEHSYALDPRRGEDYDALLGELSGAGRLPRSVVHAWNLSAAEGDPLSAGWWDEARWRGFDSLLHLSRAVERADASAHVRINVLSGDMQKVCGERALRPEKSLLLGPLKVIPQEYPNLSCLSIDLSTAEAEGTADEPLLRDLFDEMTGEARERFVAYRGGERWVQTFERLRLDDAPAGGPRLREGGVYLITGGLGGVGLVLAEEMARQVKARLVLTGRTALPEREEWPAWLSAHGERERRSQAIKKIMLLEALGSEVMTLAADVTDAAALTSAVARAEERFGPLSGVVHAAGVPGGGIIQLKTIEAAEQVFAPKVRGLLNLHAALAGREPDFLLLCSSINAVVGGFGQSDYCAANAFCDAFAQAHFSHRGTYVVSVNWDRWNEVGMAARGAGTGDALAALVPAGAPLAGTDGAASHPLLGGALVETADRAVFVSRFSPESQWVLSEHLVMGLPTVPGTTYLEMARAAFMKVSGAASVELRAVTFRAPLVVREGEAREVATLLDRTGGGYTFRVLSRGDGGGDVASPWEEHARGEVCANTPAAVAAGSNGTNGNGTNGNWAGAGANGKGPGGEAPSGGVGHRPERVARLLEGGRRLAGGAEGDHPRRSEFITTGPRWHSLKEVYVAGDEALAVLEIDERFSADLSLYGLHPSLLDIATGFVQFLAEGDYLPLVYERLTLHAPLARRVYSHVSFRGDATAPERREVITCDITVLDDEWREVVTIEGFSMRRVNEGALARPATAADAVREEARATPDLAAAAARMTAGLSPREGAEAFRRLLRAATVPQVVVSSLDINETMRAADRLNRTSLLEEFAAAGPAASAHARPDLSSAYAEPASEVERRVAAVWQRVLGVERVGAHDNFFELGGTSLTGIQLVSELKKEFDVDLPVVSIFEATTVTALARHISGGGDQTPFEMVADRAEKKKRVLGAQRRTAARREV